MANFNKVFLIGRVTRDPELRYIQSGTAVLDLGIAVNRRTKSNDGTWREEVTFVQVTVWGKTAENCAEYLSKGRPVFIEGHLNLDQWEDKKTGEKRNKLRVTAENVQFLGSREPGAGGPRPAQAQDQAKPEAPPAEKADTELSDDDIPF